jgi:small subunit ribosomal protein S2
MTKVTFEQLMEAGVHFGHLRRKWNPKMAPYIFVESNGIHLIDLKKTETMLEDAASAIRQIVRSGKKILFVATKKQAKNIVAELVEPTGMPYVTERWPGGMLTNFATIRKAIKKMENIDKLMADENSFKAISKREKLQLKREKDKLEKNLGSIKDLTRIPAAVFIVDVLKEHIAVEEAHRLKIQTFAMIDTNADPSSVDFAIPANDDAAKSIRVIVENIVEAVKEGLAERQVDKDAAAALEQEQDVEEQNFNAVSEDEEDNGFKGGRKSKVSTEMGDKNAARRPRTRK